METSELAALLERVLDEKVEKPLARIADSLDRVESLLQQGQGQEVSEVVSLGLSKDSPSGLVRTQMGSAIKPPFEGVVEGSLSDVRIDYSKSQEHGDIAVLKVSIRNGETCYILAGAVHLRLVDPSKGLAGFTDPSNDPKDRSSIGVKCMVVGLKKLRRGDFVSVQAEPRTHNGSLPYVNFNWLRNGEVVRLVQKGQEGVGSNYNNLAADLLEIEQAWPGCFSGFGGGASSPQGGAPQRAQSASPAPAASASQVDPKKSIERFRKFERALTEAGGGDANAWKKFAPEGFDCPLGDFPQFGSPKMVFDYYAGTDHDATLKAIVDGMRAAAEAERRRATAVADDDDDIPF